MITHNPHLSNPLNWIPQLLTNQSKKDSGRSVPLGNQSHVQSQDWRPVCWKCVWRKEARSGTFWVSPCLGFKATGTRLQRHRFCSVGRGGPWPKPSPVRRLWNGKCRACTRCRSSSTGQWLRCGRARRAARFRWPYTERFLPFVFFCPKNRWTSRSRDISLQSRLSRGRANGQMGCMGMESQPKDLRVLVLMIFPVLKELLLNRTKLQLWN